MQLPLNNRLRAEYVVPIPQETIQQHNYLPGLVESMNKQLMVRIADELLKAKPEIIEQTTVKNNAPYGLDHYRTQAEVYVFTADELQDLITRVQMETSIQIREQMAIVYNWKK